MNKDLLQQALINRYTRFGNHPAEVYDDPVFKKLNLEEQNTFLQNNRDSFKAPVIWTLKHPSSLALMAGASYGIANSIGSFASYIHRMYPTAAAKQELAQTIASKTGKEVGHYLTRFAMHLHDPEKFAFIPEVMKENMLGYFKSPEFIKTFAKGAGVVAGIYLISHLLNATKLKARANALLNAKTPEQGLVDSYNAQPLLSPENPGVNTAKQLILSTLH